MYCHVFVGVKERGVLGRCCGAKQGRGKKSTNLLSCVYRQKGTWRGREEFGEQVLWYGAREGGRRCGFVRYARQCGTLTLNGTISDTCESRGAE